MTAIGRPAPTIRLEWGQASGAFATALRVAVGLLTERGLVQLADAGEADVVHTVGDVPQQRATGRRVHTVDRVPLRANRLTAEHRWVRRERRRAAGVVAWLAHGPTAARMVVAARLAPGQQLHCLPVLPPAEPDRTEPDRAEPDRAALRRELGITPGTRLVLGTTPADGIGDWPAAIGRLGRPDLTVLPLAEDGQPSLRELVTAADLFVAAGHDLAACNPAVTAMRAGLPVVAVTTDSAADLIDAGHTGYVVPPSPEAIAAAVGAHLDWTVPARRVREDPTAGRRRTVDLARSLLAIYQQALATPGWGAW